MAWLARIQLKLEKNENRLHNNLMILLPERAISSVQMDSGIIFTDRPQVSQLEQDLEKERTALSQALRRREREVEEATQEVQKKERQAAELSGSIT